VLEFYLVGSEGTAKVTANYVPKQSNKYVLGDAEVQVLSGEKRGLRHKYSNIEATKTDFEPGWVN
jgi:hypothetical protein